MKRVYSSACRPEQSTRRGRRSQLPRVALLVSVQQVAVAVVETHDHLTVRHDLYCVESRQWSAILDFMGHGQTQFTIYNSKCLCLGTLGPEKFHRIGRHCEDVWSGNTQAMQVCGTRVDVGLMAVNSMSSTY